MLGEDTIKSLLKQPAWQEFIADIEERHESIRSQMETAPKDTIFNNVEDKIIRTNGFEFLQGQCLEMQFVKEWTNICLEQAKAESEENDEQDG